MSVAELCVRHALDTSDRGADVETFWRSLRLEITACLDDSRNALDP
jgi:hypothetical protein